jgi:hypothetical protein
MVVDLLAALERIDPALAGRALEKLLSQPALYAIDGVLVPAALRLHEAEETRRHASVQALRAAVLAHLRRRIAEPLKPPGDWRRPSAIACTCTYCRELSRFLDNPAQPAWRLKAAEAQRCHVEGSIRHNRCDLDAITERRGRPYTLVCTKNQASHERRVQQRRHDLEHLARLDGETG